MDFEDYLLEQLIVPNAESSEIQKRRHTMPQLSNFDAFKEDLNASRIKISGPRKVQPLILIPSQTNFSEEKVNSIIANKSSNAKPIIISDDGYVIDGHHRWLASCKLKCMQLAREVAMSAEDIFGFLKGKSYVEVKRVDQ